VGAGNPESEKTGGEKGVSPMEIGQVGVVGCGLMGSEELLQGGLGRIQKSLDRAAARGKATPDQVEQALARIQGTLDLADLAGCDLVVEAAIENMEVKKSIFSELDGILPPHAILASNTSSLCITEMASATRRADRVLGIHFFNPVPVFPLIEFVRTILTSDETMESARRFGTSLGKTMVTAKDTPGFIVNRLLIPYILDAIRVYEDGLASREDIDTAIKLGLNHPMGPLTLVDFVGLDTCLFIADAMFEEYKDARYAAPPLLRRMVLAGRLGRKSGRGFYEYG
jgi:3-hydroxybutyryl-CoA dehydrogenase